MRRRFFVDRFDGRHAALRDDSAHHAARVLRVSPGQLYELTDGRALWLARVESAARGSVEFSLVEQLPANPPALRTSLLLSIVKFDRFEWALEKATELGVTEITPLASARSEKGLISAAPKRATRWERILLESSQQSRRLAPPALNPASSPADAFTAGVAPQRGAGFEPAERGKSSAPALLFFSESPEAPPLRSILAGIPSTRHAVLAIGPEGGWTPAERSAALAAGFSEVSLGPQILRTETAVAAAVAAVNYALSLE